MESPVLRKKIEVVDDIDSIFMQHIFDTIHTFWWNSCLDPLALQPCKHNEILNQQVIYHKNLRHNKNTNHTQHVMRQNATKL